MPHLSHLYASYFCSKGRAVFKKKKVDVHPFSDALESSVEGGLQFVFIHNDILLWLLIIKRSH